MGEKYVTSSMNAWFEVEIEFRVFIWHYYLWMSVCGANVYFFVFFFVFLVIWGVKDITFFLTSTTIKDVCLWCIFISFALTFLVNGDVKVLYKKATFLMIGTSTHGFQFLVQSYGILLCHFCFIFFNNSRCKGTF